MIHSLLYTIAGLVIALLVTSALLPLIRKLALAVRAVDYPGGRRVQAEGIPRLGGVAVVVGMLAAQAVVATLLWHNWAANLEPMERVAIPLALFIVFVCGLVEDTVGISPLLRILLQTVAAALVIRAGWCVSLSSLPFLGPGFETPCWILTLLWIVGVTNAVNLLDGLDGLAGGVTAIIAAGLAIFALGTGNIVTAVAMGTMVGACLGFLRKNWAPAQIYLGDAGSLTLGFLLAIVSIHASLKISTVAAILFPLLALGLPVFDTLLVMAFRFRKKIRTPLVRRVAAVFHADRSHLHHLMLRLGLDRKRIVVGIYALTIAFCALALAAAVVRNTLLGVVFILFELAVVFAIRHLGNHAELLHLPIAGRKKLKALFFGQ
ncbi:MAG: undecaprenyl/decaprenyl-phosphate alpha-N-acetylglucosaminyl 1-phosphate transferase [Acidobacteria bacterium]|nr:undecaprenyl/decaprenyl-phosphate alpha-N-acetylglucosaminyl 1-phosphate transferase [Acidobacteriota bacterium]